MNMILKASVSQHLSISASFAKSDRVCQRGRRVPLILQTLMQQVPVELSKYWRQAYCLSIPTRLFGGVQLGNHLHTC